MKSIILCGVFIFQICACTDVEDGEINGLVLDVTTNLPIEGATVELKEGVGGGGWVTGGGGYSFPIAETRSDKDGNFTFYVSTKSEYTNYYVRAMKDLYSDGGNHEESVAYKGEPDVIFYLQPPGYLKLHIQNIPPLDDYFKIVLNTTEYSGPNVDTTFISSRQGNQDNYIGWSIYGPDTVYTSTYVYCPAFDTTFYEILY